MKKRVINMEGGKVRFVVERQSPLDQDWCSLGARAPHWTGSPWRAVSLSFQKDATH